MSHADIWGRAFQVAQELRNREVGLSLKGRQGGQCGCRRESKEENSRSCHSGNAGKVRSAWSLDIV